MKNNVVSQLRAAVSGSGQNDLKIMYPLQTDVLPVEVPVTAWLRYTDAAGNGLPGQPIHVSTSEYATVSDADVTTGDDGWATTQITFKKPNTLGTVATYQATVTVAATNNENDTDQATLTASTSAGGPGILVLDDLVLGYGPDPYDMIWGGQWTLVSGTYTLADGTPARTKNVDWWLSNESGPAGDPNPQRAIGQTTTDDNGRFCNFVLTSIVPFFWNLRVRVEGYNDVMPDQLDFATKIYRCFGPFQRPIGTIALERVDGFPFQGSSSTLGATYQRTDGSPPGEQIVSWYSAPLDVTFESYPITETDDNGASSNKVTWPNARGMYSEAVWAQVIDREEIVRGVLILKTWANPDDEGGQGPVPPNYQSWHGTMTSPDGSVFVPGVPHTLTATLMDYEGNALPGRALYWMAYDYPDQVAFSMPYPTTTDANGQASIQVTVLQPEPHPLMRIFAGAYNPITGTTQGPVFFGSVGTPVASITVTSTDPLPLALYQPHELVATYTADDNNNKSITWSAEPEGNFTFSPNPSMTSSDGQGRATTSITGYGPNVPVSGVIVYASTNNDELGKPVVGMTIPPLSFKPGAAADPNAARIDLVSVDGDPLTAGDVHLIQATYTKLDGTPIADQPIQWQAFPGKKVTLLDALTYTNEDGVATTGLTGDPASAPFDGKIQASTSNPVTHATDLDSMPLTFQQQVQQPGSIPMQLTSADAAPLAEGAWHAFTVTYAKDADIYWAAFPSDRVSFEQPNPTTTNEKGISINRVMASGDSDISAAIITARSFNVLTGTYDHADVTTSFAQPQGPEIVIVSEEDQPLTLYAPHALNATYSGSDPAIKALVWSTDPQSDLDHAYTFDPNPSPLSGGKTTTQITGVGPNANTSVAVYARSADPAHFMQGSTGLSFKSVAQPPQPSAGNALTLVSLDGNPLSAFDAHLIQATYTEPDGTPLANQPVTWKVDVAKVSLLTDPGPPVTFTDDKGVAVNGVISGSTAKTLAATITARATNPFNAAATDQGTLSVTFQQGPVKLPGAGQITLTVPPSPLTIGQSYPVSATYTSDGTIPEADQDIIWRAFPSDRVKFDPNPTPTDGTGTASTTMHCTIGSNVPNAIVHVSAFNADTGMFDHQQVTRGFENSAPAALTGVQIDKPYARTSLTGVISPTNLQQVIQGQVKLTGPNPGGKAINLTTTPPLDALPWVKMYNKDGSQLLPLVQNAYQATTDSGGTAAFRIGSSKLAVFTLQANMPGADNGPTSELALALVASDVTSPLLQPPQVPALQGSNSLVIPRDGLSFKVIIPVSANAQPADPAVLLLNDRVVYEGNLGDQPAGGVDVAYALLSATGNTLVYLAGHQGTVRESPQPTAKPFTAGPLGNAQTGPLSVDRTLRGPAVQVSSATIGPQDIVSGLPVSIAPYPGVGPGDKITLYVYLSGMDALTQKAVKNICVLTHTVAPGDPILASEPQPMPVLQAYLAGYSQGTLQIDYKVEQGDATTWSNLGQTPDGKSTTFTLNTTF